MYVQNMAEHFRSLDSLREANLLLLSKLHAAQRTVWKDFIVFKTKDEPSDGGKHVETQEFKGHGPDRTPVTLRKRGTALNGKSLGKECELAEQSLNNKRRNNDKENRPLIVGHDRLNSILRTPQTLGKTQSADGRQHVTFHPSTPNVRVGSTRNEADHSLLGYDWIAGMLDNDSYLSEKDDGFFEELKEFRGVNKDECSGSIFIQQPSKSPLINPPQEKDEGNYHSCSDTYVLDKRLFAVPIHGSESYCALCKTRKPSEYENAGSFVRVSVPRSTLQSPHRVKPHRRKSFDPTDTVSLSKHCLLGWESSRPAVIPSQSALDLRAHTGISKLNALNWSTMSARSDPKELFDSACPLQTYSSRKDYRTTNRTQHFTT